jgi:hypothetical protein
VAIAGVVAALGTTAFVTYGCDLQIDVNSGFDIVKDGLIDTDVIGCSR